MIEYIERDKAKEEILSWAVVINRPQNLSTEDTLCVLDSIPAADVVPVVRCKDCKHHKYEDITGYTWCCLDSHTRRVEMNDFCSYGKRKEGDG